jgi:NADH-quinone oxidoreductase subunit L
LAISGIPPFAGFFSKDEILVAAYNHHQIYFWVEWIVAGLTAFYMFRLYFGIFWGKEKEYEHTPHEAPFSMTFPLIFLAIASAVVGFIPFSNFVTSDGLPFDIHMHWNIALPSIGIALFGIIVAFVFYKKESDLPNRAVASFGSFYKYALNKFYFDELYLFVARKVIFKRFSSPIAWFDRHIIDATMDGVASVTNYIALKIKGLQSGQLQQYASVFVSGVLLLIVIFIYLLSS